MHKGFPIPSLSEAFFDRVVSEIGGHRFDEICVVTEGLQNPDYVIDHVLLELKLIQEEGLNKPERQRRIAKFIESYAHSPGSNDFYDTADERLKREIDDCLLGPIKSAVRKASAQFADAKLLPQFSDYRTVLIAANSGYSSLDPNTFCRLVKHCVLKDQRKIDLVICVSLHHHQGDFDTYVFLETKEEELSGWNWPTFQTFRESINALFNERMTEMMRDQMNPALWQTSLEPIADITFNANGIAYIKRAPEVPDSRFET